MFWVYDWLLIVYNIKILLYKSFQSRIRTFAHNILIQRHIIAIIIGQYPHQDNTDNNTNPNQYKQYKLNHFMTHGLFSNRIHFINMEVYTNKKASNKTWYMGCEIHIIVYENRDQVYAQD